MEVFMLIGHINTDYIMFVIKNDEKQIKEMVDDMAASIRLEYDLRNMNIMDEEDFWDF